MANLNPKPGTPPFTSRDLLDMTYGYIEVYEKDSKRCECGRTVRIVDARMTPLCSTCPPRNTRVIIDYGPETPTVNYEGDRYEFYANHWWKLDDEGQRKRFVRAGEKARQLDRLGGRGPAPKAPPLEPIVTYVEWTDGQRLPWGVKPCWCPSPLMHAHFSLEGKPCPAHEKCIVCGENHAA